jgi:mRNA interferase YafQ
MRTIKGTNQYERDYKRETKGKSAVYADKLDAELAAVVTVLVADGTLQDRHQDHVLSGKWKGP